jgi:hypothetical protein
MTSSDHARPSIEPPPAADAGSPIPRHALLWAVYLGCSWAWVIGMFLPTLLVRDYGLAGYWTFAIPNVVGAGAMGFVLMNAGAARRLAVEHRSAVRWFSWWTIAFHLFAMPWLVEGVLVTGGGGRGLGLAMAASLLGGVVLLTQQRRWAGGLGLCVLVAGVSWLIAGVYAATASDVPRDTPFEPRLSEAALVCFAVPNLLGFLLCPYLDATFLRARAETTPGGGRVAFAVGFGVVFFSMIGFALLYSRTVLEGIYTDRPIHAAPLQLSLVGLFIALQGSLTVGLHLRELRRPIPATPDAASADPVAPPRPVGSPLASPLAVTLLVIAAGLGLYFALTHREASHALPAPELVYRVFLTAYGVVIPAYVWLVIWPTRSGKSRDTGEPAEPARVGPGEPPIAPDRRKRLILFAITSLLAYPLGLIGFTAGPAWLLVVAGGVVTLARLPIGVPRLRLTP